ncbi:hypothetical protein DPEC_G00345530 [Dallia pectoralis]|uniref:Uncharacterized protein n=1 Tax=Dallia pectoralis TaxID=75939 RepID=A0ACC2F3J8_DALPE|nr:hypothetical protein DPEC_G00345530 [Dallia pectoralis]
MLDVSDGSGLGLSCWWRSDLCGGWRSRRYGHQNKLADPPARASSHLSGRKPRSVCHQSNTCSLHHPPPTHLRSAQDSFPVESVTLLVSNYFAEFLASELTVIWLFT